MSSLEVRFKNSNSNRASAADAGNNCSNSIRDTELKGEHHKHKPILPSDAAEQLITSSIGKNSISSSQSQFDSIDLGGEFVEFDITHSQHKERLPLRTASNIRGSTKAYMTDLQHDTLGDGDLGNSTTSGYGPNNITGSALNYESLNEENEEREETYTIEDAIEQFGYGKFQFRISLLAGLAWTADAMEMMVLAILSPALLCAWGLKTWELSLITSVVFIGMMIGSTVWGKFSDRYGRKFALIVSSTICLWYGILSALSTSLVWLLVFRMLVGFGVAGGSQSVTLYSEFLPIKARAKSIVGIEVFFALGAAFEAILGYLVMPTLGWRYLLVFSAIPLVCFMIACMWLPESMRFNLTRGHYQAALDTLKKCAAENNKPMPLGKLVNNTFNENRGQFKDLFTVQFRRTTIILWIIWFANTFCYYGLVLVTTELLELNAPNTCEAISSAGEAVTCSLDCRPLTGKNYLELLWTTVAEFPGLILTFFVIDWIGRKLSFTSQFFLFGLFTALVLACSSRTFMIVCLFCARAFISGAFQTAFVYTPEVYPTNIRATALGCCSSFARFGAVITPFIAQGLLLHSIYAAVGIYTAVAVAAGLLSFLLPIETKGKDLMEK